MVFSLVALVSSLLAQVIFQLALLPQVFSLLVP